MPLQETAHMEDLEQERKQKRREALEEYQKIISYEITPGTAEPVRNRKPSRRFRIRFRHIFFGAAVIVTAFCYFFIGNQLRVTNERNKALQKELTSNLEQLSQLEENLLSQNGSAESTEESAAETEESASDVQEETVPPASFTAIYPLTSSCVILHTYGPYAASDGSSAYSYGLDLGTEQDTDVIAAESGTVLFAGEDEETGLTVRIDHGNGYITHYCYNKELRVNAGETVTLQARQLQLSETGDSDEFRQYTKNIRFKDECLEDILRVVNAEASALQIQTASPVLSKRKLTIEFENNSPETVAELICWALSLKCSREGDKLILSE